MKKRLFVSLLLCSFWLQALSFPHLHAAAQSAAGRTKEAEGERRLAGLSHAVTVWRDERGIPYIEAAGEKDLYFAQGYITAGDRLWQMDMLRRTGRGELAEILGREALGEDKHFRQLGFAALAEQRVGRLSPPVRAALESYAEGVNAAIRSLDDRSLPPEFRILKYRPRPWRPSDSLVIGKIFAESLSPTWLWETMRALFSDLPKERLDALYPSTSPLDVIMVGSDEGRGKRASAAPVSGPARGRAGDGDLLSSALKRAGIIRRSLKRVGLYAEDAAASNNWVVSGKRTLSGKPLLANDPHLDSSAPNVWYVTHLRTPELRVAGAAIPGAPGIIIGHNERIAWGITNLFADVQDLYIEKFDKENPRRYLTPGGWREAEVRREEIKVRKSPLDPTTETVSIDVTLTRHGPIILESKGARLALRWTTLDPAADEFEVYYWINRAGDWRQFRRALSGYSGVGLNYIYADVRGNIGYWGAGRFPLRNKGDGSSPNDGATDAGEWTGYIPFEAMPHVYNPPSGVIVTANNRIVGLDYPYHLTRAWIPPYRARRIYDLLMAREKLTVDDFLRIQADTYSYPDATFINEVVKLARPLAAGAPDWREVLSTFDGWDKMMKTESRVPVLAYRMRVIFVRRILMAALGPDLWGEYTWPNASTLLDHIISARPREWLPKEFSSYEELLLSCYKAARGELAARLGKDESRWTWGGYYRMRFPHALENVPLVGAQFAIEPVPQNGSVSTVNRGESVSMRIVADLNDWDNTRQCLQLGQSGNPASPHWKDQLAEWLAVNPRPFPFTPGGIGRAAREKIALVPSREK